MLDSSIGAGVNLGAHNGFRFAPGRFRNIRNNRPI